MTMKIKYWAFNAKTGRKPWVVTCGDKRSYFNTEEEAQKFVKLAAITPNSNPGLTLDKLVFDGEIPTKPYGEKFIIDYKAIKPNVDYYGNAVDFISYQRMRCERGQIAWHFFKSRVLYAKQMCDVLVNGKRVGLQKVAMIDNYMMRKQVLKSLEQNNSSKTCKEYWTAMSQVFDYAILEKEVITNNPCDKISLEDYGRKTGKEGKVRRVKTVNVQKLIDAMPHPRSNENRTLLDWRILANFAAQTGLRQGEQRSIKWKDLDLDKKFVFVSHSMTSSEDGQIDQAGTKRDRLKKDFDIKVRKVGLSDALVAQLKELYIKDGCPDKDEYVWTTEDNKILPQNRFSRMMRKVCRRAGIEQITWHELRHYYTAERLQRDRVERVSAALGHSATNITESTYGHFIQNDQYDEEECESANNSSLVMAQAGAS